MRVADLDRDMRDVIPSGTTPDSDYLFARMTARTHALAWPDPVGIAGRRILDLASGIGQDVVALTRRGAWSVGVEPSPRMLGLAFALGARACPTAPHWIRAWSDALPFASESFDAVICKGSLDHFERPLKALEEMARVTRPAGRVVLAVANFDSLACRLARAGDGVREVLLRRPVKRGRRFYDVPSDHFTRYDLELMREQASRCLELDVVEGVSLCWGFPPWARLTRTLPAALVQPLLRSLDRMARARPSLADVVLLAGRPRSASSSR